MIMRYLTIILYGMESNKEGVCQKDQKIPFLNHYCSCYIHVLTENKKGFMINLAQ